MPGPFPGMDPYLELPAHWQGVHNKLITHLEEALNAILPAAYVATAETRCYIETVPNMLASGSLRPDVSITRSTYTVGAPAGGVATQHPALGSFMVEVHPLDVREAYVEIVDAGDRSRIVTSIEILSHTNKSARNRGRRLYLTKQKGILRSRTHLLEIDLLRSGIHTAAVPLDRVDEPSRYDYLVCLHRSFLPNLFQIWPFTVRDRLPAISIPLDRDVPELEFALQPMFDDFYDAGAYGKKIDYNRDPEPPHSTADALWAAELLLGKGKRVQHS
jgi:hypothetical protein